VKTVVLVAPHFVPSFLPSVHRARLWSYYLPEFGWKPTILTTHERHYECQTAPELLELLPSNLEVIRVSALPNKPIRWVGDIGIRSFPFYIRALNDLAAKGRIDFLHITIPSNYTALLGPIIYKKHGIPYGIDYIDPWVRNSSGGAPASAKAWLSDMLARLLEPYAVRNARLITGINTAYFEPVLQRHPHLRTSAVTAGMPYGGSDHDYEVLNRNPRKFFLFDPNDDRWHVVYAGALLPKATDILDRFLEAVSEMRTADDLIREKLRIHFVGTGLYESESAQGHVVLPFIEKHNLQDCVTEYPARIPYLDVLNHLRQAFAILVIGSIETFYSPSKIYQSVMSQRPVFALLHERSTAVSTMQKANAGEVFTFTEKQLPDPNVLAEHFANFLRQSSHRIPTVNWDAFREVSARESARILATAMDEALERHRQAKR
jgi:hypothetical protein